MTVKLSDRELLGVWSFLCGAVWGNTPETLLDQEEIWRVLGLEERFSALKDKPQTDMLDHSDELRDFELSAGAVGLLKMYLARPQQPLRMGLESARALRRLGS